VCTAYVLPPDSMMKTAGAFVCTEGVSPPAVLDVVVVGKAVAPVTRVVAPTFGLVVSPQATASAQTASSAGASARKCTMVRASLLMTDDFFTAASV
jgi:hypothetical protein